MHKPPTDLRRGFMFRVASLSLFGLTLVLQTRLICRKIASKEVLCGIACKVDGCRLLLSMKRSPPNIPTQFPSFPCVARGYCRSHAVSHRLTSIRSKDLAVPPPFALGSELLWFQRSGGCESHPMVSFRDSSRCVGPLSDCSGASSGSAVRVLTLCTSCSFGFPDCCW